MLIRLMHVADLPPPGELVKRVSSGQIPAAPAAGTSPGTSPGAPAGAAPMRNGNGATNAIASSYVGGGNGGGTRAAARLEVVPQEAPPAFGQTAAKTDAAQLAEPKSFDDIVALFRARREAILLAHLLSDGHLVHFEPGRLEFRPSDRAPANLANRIAACLLDWTGKRWLVSLSNAAGEATLKQKEAAAIAERKAQAAAHPLGVALGHLAVAHQVQAGGLKLAGLGQGDKAHHGPSRTTLLGTTTMPPVVTGKRMASAAAS